MFAFDWEPRELQRENDLDNVPLYALRCQDERCNGRDAVHAPSRRRACKSFRRSLMDEMNIEFDPST